MIFPGFREQLELSAVTITKTLKIAVPIRTGSPGTVMTSENEKVRYLRNMNVGHYWSGDTGGGQKPGKPNMFNMSLRFVGYFMENIIK